MFGIDAFCYYHYWFEGRHLLERPFTDVLRSGEPDLSFCLCWANENWTRAWNGGAQQILLAQTYSREDDLRHIRWLASAFADPRYLRVDGRPVLLVYRPSRLPAPLRTVDVWRTEADRLGVGVPYLCAVQSFVDDRYDPTTIGFDAGVQFAPDFSNLDPKGQWLRRAARKYLHLPSPYRRNRVFDYSQMVERMLATPRPPYLQFPCVTPGFDNSSRRREGGATILTNSTPERYEYWLTEVIKRFEPPSPEENLVFVNAWNEWAEGNHLEPCARWGSAYLEAHGRSVLREQRDQKPFLAAMDS